MSYCERMNISKTSQISTHRFTSQKPNCEVSYIAYFNLLTYATPKNNLIATDFAFEMFKKIVLMSLVSNFLSSNSNEET